MKTKNIVTAALAISAIFVFTAFVSFPIGSFGYLNIGDAIIMLFASLFSPLLALFIAGTATLMADISLGYAQYAVFTFVIKGMEAFLVSILIKKLGVNKRILIFVLAGLVVIFGYGLTDVILTGEWYLFLESITFNSIQVIASIIIASLAFPLFTKVMKKYM